MWIRVPSSDQVMTFGNRCLTVRWALGNVPMSKPGSLAPELRLVIPTARGTIARICLIVGRGSEREAGALLETDFTNLEVPERLLLDPDRAGDGQRLQGMVQ